jgi:hypothetical protein
MAPLAWRHAVGVSPRIWIARLASRCKLCTPRIAVGGGLDYPYAHCSPVRCSPDDPHSGVAAGNPRGRATAVATNTKLYTFTVPPTVQGLTPDELNSLRSRQIEPAVGARDWSGAAVAAADGLNKSPSSSASSSKRIWLLIAIGVAGVVVVVVVYGVRRRRRAARRVGPGDGQVNVDGRDRSLGQALSTAEARLRQISDYVAKYREIIGAEAQTRLEEAKRHLAAARGKQASNAPEAVAYANWASTLAAQAQTLANADVLAAHRAPRRRGSASTR